MERHTRGIASSMKTSLQTVKTRDEAFGSFPWKWDAEKSILNIDWEPVFIKKDYKKSIRRSKRKILIIVTTRPRRYIMDAGTYQEIYSPSMLIYQSDDYMVKGLKRRPSDDDACFTESMWPTFHSWVILSYDFKSCHTIFSGVSSSSLLFHRHQTSWSVKFTPMNSLVFYIPFQ